MPVRDITSHLIKQKYIMIKTSCELNQDIDKIYDLTPHPMRYTCLKHLKLLSLPISLAFYVTKLCFTANPSWKWIGINILYKKMDQAIAKKILHGLPDEIETDQNIPEIIEHVFKKYDENPILTPLIEPTFMQKFLAKADKYIPAFSKIVKFWNEGGINYSDEIQIKRELINVIYKQIVSKAYEVGKKGGKLEIIDVQALFPEINFEERIDAASENHEIEKVEVSNEERLICKISIAQQHAEAMIATNANNNISPLVNLLTLKDLHDGMRQEALKTYVEHCLAEVQISKNQEILGYLRYEDSLARLQLCSNNSYNYNNNDTYIFYDNNDTYISEELVAYLGQNYEHLTAQIACY